MFKKYSSLTNSYKKDFVDQCEMLDIKEWIATEKLHGSNFSFISVNGEVTPAKRNSIIGMEPSGCYTFYGCNDVFNQHKAAVAQLEAIIGQPITVFGELYGQGVMKEIQYSNKAFAGFDIWLHDSGTYLPYNAVRERLDLVGIPRVPELAQGSLRELLAMPAEFTSKLCNAKAEGMVIRPAYGPDSQNYTARGDRAIIKHKSKAFLEKKQRAPRGPSNLEPEVQEHLNNFLAYITEARLSNVLSKEDADVGFKDFGRITGLFLQDAWDEFSRDEYAMEKSHRKAISRMITKEAQLLIRRKLTGG